MIWLTWRQFRTQAAVVFAAVLAMSVVLAATGSWLRVLSRTAGEAFLDQIGAEGAAKALYLVGIGVLYVVPAVVGAFWGAPLVSRELDAGTHRLVWNQTVTRRRWLATKLGLTGLVAMAAAGLASLAVSWWSGPIDRAIDSTTEGHYFFDLPRLLPVVFGARGIVPVGYAAFALALGVTAGLLVRRVVPAMAITLAVFAAVQIVMPVWVRPHLIPPAQVATTITEKNLTGIQAAGPDAKVRNVIVSAREPGAWVLSSWTVDGSGTKVETMPSWVATCMPPPGTAGSAAGPKDGPSAAAQACFDRLEKEGYRQLVTYQPASRFWAFQWIETGIYLGIALLLTGFTFWWIRGRVS